MECVGRAADFRDGKMVKVLLSGHKHSRDALLVVRVGDRFYAIENACAHKDAKLHRGDIEDLGSSVNAAVGDGSSAGGLCVRCPKHQRKFCGGLWFSLATGKSFIDGHSRKYDPKWRQATHATEVRSDGNLYVSVAPVNWRTIRDTAKEEAAAATAAATKAHDRGHAAIGLSQPAKAPTSTALTSVVGVQDKPVEVPEWSPWQLTSVKQYSHDTAVFTFVPALSSSDGAAAAAALAKAQRRAATAALANRTSWHLSLKLRYKNMVGLSRSVDREYTPVSDLAAWEAGRVDILIKVYPKGKLTSRLAKARIGDIMELGQLATTLPFPWLAPAATHAGAAAGSNSSGAGGAGGGAGATTSAATATAAAAATPTHMLLIAGGTGMAPMWQLCNALLTSPRPSWPASLLLLCSNRTPGDVLLHKELAALQQKHKSQLRVVHTITGGTAAKGAWAGEVGRITVDMLRKYVKPGTVASSAAVVSGPEGMWADMRDALLKLGYTPQRMHELEA